MKINAGYVESLERNKGFLQPKLDELLVKYKGQPAGIGYWDIITPRDNYISFIDELTELEIAIESVSWWCHCSPENEKKYGCPHGMGGPLCNYFDGWYSEMPDYDKIIVDAKFDSTVLDINSNALFIIKNKKTREYHFPENRGVFSLDFKKDTCFTPGLCLFVPEDWKNKGD